MKVPSLLSIYGALERRLSPCLDELVRSPEFTRAAAFITSTKAGMGHAIEGWNARVLHAFNFPAETDVKGLRRQVGDLDHEVRALRLELARLIEERDDAG